MTELGTNTASIRGKLRFKEGPKSVGAEGRKVANLTVELAAAPRAGAEPIIVDVEVWGDKAANVSSMMKGNTVEIVGEVRMAEWESKKASPSDKGTQPTDSKVVVYVSDSVETHRVDVAKADDAVNMAEISGELVWLSDVETKSWKGEDGEKSAPTREAFVAVPIETRDGKIAKPTVRVRFFGHDCNNLNKGDTISLRGEVQNDKWQAAGTGDEKINRYRGTVFVGIGGDLEVRSAVAA